MKWVTIESRGEVLHVPAGEEDYRPECEFSDSSCEYGIFGCYMEDSEVLFCDAAHPPGNNPENCELCKELKQGGET